jgi:nucleotide-binding universal stress UspA family protein
MVAAELGSSGIQTEQVVDLGDPVNSLIELIARQRVDLIIVGTHARRGFLRLLKGSTTESIVDGASVPILVVPWRDSA